MILPVDWSPPTRWVSLESMVLIVRITGELRGGQLPLGLRTGFIEGELGLRLLLFSPFAHGALLRSGNTFGDLSAKVTVTSFNPDVLGVYAGTDGRSKPTIVIVNKDPSKPVSLNISGIPTGKYFIRHFGGQAGVAKFQVSLKKLYVYLGVEAQRFS